MPRSGSTWLFNTIRLILTHAGVPDFASGFMDQREELLLHQNALIKIHHFDAELAARADVILTSHRDLRDVAASASRHFRMDYSLPKVAAWVKGHVRWSQVSSYDLHYENLLVDRLAEVRKVAAVLRLPPEMLAAVSCEQVLREVEGEKFADRPATTAAPHDAVNLLHKGHITDGRHGSWKDSVPELFIGLVENEFRGWMACRGYLPPGAPRA